MTTIGGIAGIVAPTPPTIATVPAPGTPGSTASATSGLDPLHAKLRQTADNLEGMFLRQLFSAMRATVPNDTDGSAGGSMFTGMLDDSLADRAATQMRRGLGDAIYRQLCSRLSSSGDSHS
jgi:Rod binding domain-containing protein